MLVQCLDTSGSMSGAPMTALKEGSKLIGEKYWNAEEHPFEKFYTIDYNSQATMFECDSLQNYHDKIDKLRAGGGTNFFRVFQKLEKYVEDNQKLEELVVIFITDGQDGYRG